MRWLVVWLLLTGTQALGWLVSRLLPGAGAPGEDLAHLAVIPLVQAVALAVVAAVRRHAPPPEDALPPPAE